jgi:pimeloyl-ACP methyl ester carboxylesterase
MTVERKLFILLGLIASGLVLSSCVIKDLKDDLDSAVQEYGYFKAEATGPDDGSDILIGLFKRDEGRLSIANLRTVSSGETFYLLVPNAEYTVLAYSDSNGDFAYQPGEPAARVDNPVINWFKDIQHQDRIDYEALQIQQIELANTTTLEKKLDLSIEALHKETGAKDNFLSVVTWDDERFSTENATRSLWEPIWFQKEIGFGLYVLEKFDPTKKSILLVHGVLDSPPVFETLAETIPDEYQLLLFHYPSGFPLEYTAYALNEVLDELVRRNQIPQLDIIAHSMGGLVSKGLLSLADDALNQRLRLFISIASPFGGDASAVWTKWSPVVAPVWWALVPDSPYLQKIAEVDLLHGPRHHLIFSYSHEAGGKSEGDDGVVTLNSQLEKSSQRNATAIYGIADNHKGVVSNPCTLALVTAILQDGSTRVTIPDC